MFWDHLEIPEQFWNPLENFEDIEKIRTVLKMSGKFQDHLEISEQLWNPLEDFEVIREKPDSCETMWIYMNSFKTPLKILKTYGKIWTVLKPSGKFWDHLEISEQFWNSLEDFEVIRNE